MTGMPRIIVALDLPSAGKALAFAGRVSPAQCRLKVGLELFTAAGPQIVTDLTALGFDVFLDLKFHDIPSTVAKACLQAAALGAWMINVHTLGGLRMLQEARTAVDACERRPLLVGVTVLTSHTGHDLEEIGVSGSVENSIESLAVLASRAGLDGVVCSPLEAAALRKRFGKDFTLVTPGIRPTGSGADDQRRVRTPRQAIEEGADYLVIGRPVTQAPDPPSVLASINREIGGN